MALLQKAHCFCKLVVLLSQHVSAHVLRVREGAAHTKLATTLAVEGAELGLAELFLHDSARIHARMLEHTLWLFQLCGQRTSL